MPNALFISPHLDDVAFSCGGTLARLVDAGWSALVCTLFTASVPDPSGFALACQTDKGIAPEVDYMALRRREDAAFADRIGADVRHLGFPEAPHRGYEGAPALFGGIHDGDDIDGPIARALIALIESFAPDLILAPQGLGSHVDHLQTIRALRTVQHQQAAQGSTNAALPIAPIAWYRDTPYATRHAGEVASPLSTFFETRLHELGVGIEGVLDHKLDAVAAYASQLGFQFGSESDMRTQLTNFASLEARRLNLDKAAEAFAASAASSLPDLFTLTERA